MTEHIFITGTAFLSGLFNRVGPVSAVIFTGFIAYAIVRHKLMEIAAKKIFILTGIFTFMFGIFMLVNFFAQEYLVTILGSDTRFVILLLGLLLITIGIRPIERFLTKVGGRILFKHGYDYQQILKEASEGMTLVTDMKKLLNLIVRVVSKNIRVKNAAMFQLDDEKGVYILKIGRGPVRKHMGYCFDKGSVLVSWLNDNKKALLCHEAENVLRSIRFSAKQKELKAEMAGVKKELHSVNGVVCIPSFSKGRLVGFLVLGEKLSGDRYTSEDIYLLSTLANEAAIAVENAKNFMELEKLREKERESYIQTVLALAKTVDERDSYTRGHLENVSLYGMKVAEELEGSFAFKDQINRDDLRTALSLHDIGKIGVPDAILHKNGSLTSEEWIVMKQHCEIGARIVEPIEKLKNVGNIIKHHQEKYDGSGYPDGLKGEEIPLESRIIAVVDAYHAMISDRPYRKALPEEVALRELKNNIGTQFDPIVVGAFIMAWEKGKINRI